MIFESVGAFDGWDVIARQGIAHFEIVLASADLTDVPPGRCGIVTERVVHPFANFMGGDRSVVDSGTEQAGEFGIC
jgi:hypothetical protein